MSFKEKFENMQIDMNQFYKLGIICFFVIGTANIFTLVNNWTVLMLSAKVSSMFGIIFNFGLVGLFNYLKGTLPGNGDKGKEAPSEIEFDEIVDSIMNEEEKKN